MSLEKIALEIAKKDSQFRNLLIQRIREKQASNCLQKYYDTMIGPQKKWENGQSGRCVGFWRMMQIDPEFKQKYTQKAKTWWMNQQKRERDDPHRMRIREISDDVENRELKVKDLIRGLESQKKRTKNIRNQAFELRRGLKTLTRRVNKLTKGVKRDRMLHRIDRLSKKLDGLTSMKNRREAPKIRGRKRSS